MKENSYFVSYTPWNYFLFKAGIMSMHERWIIGCSATMQKNTSKKEKKKISTF